MTTLRDAVPVLPVRDLDRSIDHYAALGFEVVRYEGEERYAYARFDDVTLHLWEVAGGIIDPERNFTSVFLHVDDADALSADWAEVSAASEYPAPTTEAIETDYGMREAAHIDPDGNLLRFGHRIDRPGADAAADPAVEQGVLEDVVRFDEVGAVDRAAPRGAE